MKRFICVLLTVTMLFSLAGCSNKVSPLDMSVDEFTKWVEDTPAEDIVKWFREMSAGEFEAWLNGDWMKNLPVDDAEAWKLQAELARRNQLGLSELLSSSSLAESSASVSSEQDTIEYPTDFSKEGFQKWLDNINIFDLAWCVKNDTETGLSRFADSEWAKNQDSEIVNRLKKIYDTFTPRPSFGKFELVVPAISTEGVTIPKDKLPQDMTPQEFTKWIQETPALDVVEWFEELPDEEYEEWLHGEWRKSLPNDPEKYGIADVWKAMADFIRK